MESRSSDGVEEGELSESGEIPSSSTKNQQPPLRLISATGIVRGTANPLARRKWHGCCTLDDFEMEEKVGEGTFGEVHKAIHQKNGKVVALKKIFSRAEQEGFPITALREIKLLKQLRHPNVVELLDMAADKDSIYMVFPFMDHDLTGLLGSESIHFSIPQVKCYMKQLLEGIRYLHKSEILHRDIKGKQALGSNILINNRGELRITDFGLARPLEENRINYTPGVVTMWYRPPELLFGATEYGSAVDMWGAGCILAEMHTKKPLLPGESDLHQIELISRLCGTPTAENMPCVVALPDFAKFKLKPYRRRVAEEFKSFDPLAVDLIDKLLILDPKARLTADEALQHPYFKNKPHAALPQELPTYASSHEYTHRKNKMRPPHPTPHEHAAHSSSHPFDSTLSAKVSPPPPPPPPPPSFPPSSSTRSPDNRYRRDQSRDHSRARPDMDRDRRSTPIRQRDDRSASRSRRRESPLREVRITDSYITSDRGRDHRRFDRGHYRSYLRDDADSRRRRDYSDLYNKDDSRSRTASPHSRRDHTEAPDARRDRDTYIPTRSRDDRRDDRRRPRDRRGYHSDRQSCSRREGYGLEETASVRHPASTTQGLVSPPPLNTDK